MTRAESHRGTDHDQCVARAPRRDIPGREITNSPMRTVRRRPGCVQPIRHRLPREVQSRHRRTQSTGRWRELHRRGRPRYQSALGGRVRVARSPRSRMARSRRGVRRSSRSGREGLAGPRRRVPVGAQPKMSLTRSKKARPPWLSDRERGADDFLGIVLSSCSTSSRCSVVSFVGTSTLTST